MHSAEARSRQGPLQRPDASIAGIWPRAAAFLARQELEVAMGEIWASKRQAAELSGSNLRSQVLCLNGLR
jgi:hypothetical protein